MMTFKDQVAIITGASSGIGRAIAIALGEKGANLCLIGRNLEALYAVANLAQRIQNVVVCCQADLSLDGDIKAVADRIQGSFGGIDILIHSAGTIFVDRLEAGPVEAFDTQYRINVRAPYLLTQMLLPLLRAYRGQVVFINSSAGIMANANVGQYAATKHALKAIADSFRQEVNAEGLRVLSVFPGRTATRMQATIHRIEGKEYHPELLMQPEDVAAVLLSALNLPRTAEVTEIMIRPFVKP